MSSPIHITKELRKQVKRAASLGNHEMWEETALPLEKAACAQYTHKFYQVLKETTGKKAVVSEFCQRQNRKSH